MGEGGKKGAYSKIILFLCLIIMILLVSMMGSDEGTVLPAEEEEASDYQIMGNQLNINWEWIMLIDMFESEQNGTNLNQQNPVYTSLNCLKVTIDIYEEEENDEGDTHWVYAYSDYANGAEEILSYFGLPADTKDLNLVTAAFESWDAQEEYKITIEPYASLEEVLNTYYNFPSEVQFEILELEKEHYLAEVYGKPVFNGSGGIFEGEINAQVPAVGMKIPLYYQYQEPWRGIKFGGGTISTSGCSITSMAMVFSYLHEETITPDQLAAWAGNRYYVAPSGQSWSIFPAASSKWGIHCSGLGTNINSVIGALSEGRPVIASMRPGTFTKAGHFIVLRGITEDGKILVNDPNDNASKQFFNKSFDVSLIKRESKQFWAFSN